MSQIESISRFWVLMIQKKPPKVLYEKGVVKNFTNFTGKHLCQSLFFKKFLRNSFLRVSLLKKVSGTSIFLWILWNFQERLFYRTPLVAASGSQSQKIIKTFCWWSYVFINQLFNSQGIRAIYLSAATIR